MHGFKSFANRTELVFGDKFNCILGPNGSGKSNVLDALCFVLGKSSSKALRAEKSANLIYNGGKAKEPAKHGEVSIYFDNSSKIFPNAGLEVKITRIIKQDGQSVYRIDNKNVTRQQIIELLSMARVNPDGYNIILQGDIVSFIEMSPVERRKIVEELGGISVYEEKREKALRELENVEEKLKEVEIILTERNSFLKELKKERDQALKYKDLDDKIKQNKATLVRKNLDDKTEQLVKTEKEIALQKKEIEKIQKEINQLKELVKQKKIEQEKITKEIEEKGDKEQLNAQREIENLKVENTKILSKIQNLNVEVERINQRKEQLNTNLIELTDKQKSMVEEKNSMDLKLKNNTKELTQIDSKILEFKKKNKMEDAGNIEKEVEILDKLADEKQIEITNLRQKEQEIIREEDRLMFQVQGVDQKIGKVAEIAEEHKSEIEKIKQMRTEFKKATLELNTRLNEDSSYSAQLNNARTNLLRRQEESAKLAAKNASIIEKIAGGEAIKKILEQKKEIPGIYGTVSDLGKVSAEYALAMEVAAGSRVKSVVVEDDKTAAECIKYLKRNQLGTVTFLPLNKIRAVKTPDNIEAILKTPGVIGLSTTLMSYEPKFKNAFSFVLGSAIIVNNIETARKIGIGACKMVTLDGDLSEASGAMTGGFRKRSVDGVFKEKEAAERVERVEAEIADLSNIISKLERKKTENEDNITKLREFKANVEGEIIKTEKSLHLEEGDLETDKKLKKELQQRLDSIRKESHSLQDKIAYTLKELTDAKIKKQQLRAEISELKNPRLLAELNAFEQKKQQLKDENIRLSADTKSLQTQIDTTFNPQIENIQKILKQHDKEKTDFQKDAKESQITADKQKKDILEKEKKQKEFYAQFKGLFDKREKTSNEITKSDANIISKEETIRKEEHRASALMLELARVKSELGAIEEEFKQFKDVEILKDKPLEQIKKEIAQFEKMTSDLGAVNLKALEVYDKAEAEYKGLQDKQNTLSKEREDVLLMMNEIETKKKELFLASFEIVNKNFAAMFLQLSAKGEAMLELEDEKEPFNGGLLVKVRISGKKFLDIRSLSGGEKTMAALAFIFSIQENEPAPFYVLDEVDAALDKANSEKLANLVKAYSKRAQYIIISHNDNVINNADLLYGVSMNKDSGTSKVVSLKV